ncbi:FAD-dependent oxidoreductase [Gordonia sp. (in: high G+C Gram-positive bacteria)]|uniref:NAD(P)/FAD-dependent oxidoreductase n=1 Tax=Gordonia sp. (in: high G+C Gram-positive bacteria) TaxID=84139 RepID=UPI0025C58506|nr:FAD-dependent oxidoreductase [Gordonia sp. (in: high G+C Gram-positive bacteria)]
MTWACEPTERSRAMVAGASPEPYWLDRPERPAPRPRLAADVEADLLIVGGGFTGLWSAVQAAERHPGLRIVLLERDRIAEHATGRNGGFCSASITHGLGNGLARWPDEMPTLVRLGKKTLDEIEATIERLGIASNAGRTGELDIANFDWQAVELAGVVDDAAAVGQKLDLLSAEAARARVDSPMIAGATFDPDVIMLDPARLAWGLAAAAERLGVTIHEHTEVGRLRSVGEKVVATTGYGSVTAAKAVLATSASPSLVRRLRMFTVPVWDYAIMTEPLSGEQLASLGWAGREGLADNGPRFHYFRLTADNRILFGGWDALYHFGSDADRRHEFEPAEFALLAEHLLQFFPQLEGIKASHTWGGLIDTCSRFSAFWDTSHKGRVVTVTGFTGLGVGASHFGAAVALDLLDGVRNERTELKMVKSKPIPFPPEPARWIGVNITRHQIARSERRQGKRGLWLTIMDKTGLGFDS